MLLENLHEDCNQVSKKPYVEQKDSNGRADHIVAKEYWDGFLQREKSVFIDLFYGQLKSHVQCTRCKNISIAFDPYNVLSVPIPTRKKQIVVGPFKIPFYMNDLTKPVLEVTID